MKLNTGDIAFIMHHDNLISRTLSWFMGSKWSHCFLILGEYPQGTYILETSDFEVCISILDKYLIDEQCSIEIYSGGISKEEADVVTNKAMITLGDVYGYLHLLGLGIRRLFRKVGIKIGNPLKGGVVCCCVPMLGYQDSSIQDLAKSDWQDNDTEDLYQIVKNSPQMKLVYEK